MNTSFLAIGAVIALLAFLAARVVYVRSQNRSPAGVPADRGDLSAAIKAFAEVAGVLIALTLLVLKGPDIGEEKAPSSSTRTSSSISQNR